MGFTLGNVHAPQFPAHYKDGNTLKWFNLPEHLPILSLKDLRGKVILVDFWTYSCINCQRTLPFLQKWWETYKDFGLVIIGVHAPEFEFEKSEKNVKAALQKYGVEYPVVLDNDFQIWDAYANHYWPSKYLINHHGNIVYSHAGEGNYIETEIQIQSALKEAGFEVAHQLVSAVDNQTGGLWKTQSLEMYFGSLRGKVQKLNQAQIRSNDPSVLKKDHIYIIGEWKQEKEYLQHARITTDLDDLVIISYTSKNVYIVMENTEKLPTKVYITLDGIALTPENAGKDIQFDEEQRAFVLVEMATLYHVISTNSFGDHILRLSTTSDQIRLFSVNFGL